ncbi:putative metallophosphoesterase YhaO [Caulifigura coniformis]|uniref:Putative metallophosphoesterase YhaO n=1 Tax=Caulifigura coniformis TaxID=2527983 RepID=A0A517S826_9PLAN|nr:hypothetical protein [Caulifigura coniformis]QDT52276.1 putative metallophosphoesterase YhaO [Caulifigura coniformis]
MSDVFRFVHATNLRLDQPLTGAGALTADERALVEDATLTAFARIIDACIQHQVDCLLLTGDCFEFQSGTLRGRLQMQRGLERLSDKGISAFILCGALDPPSSWKRGMALPPNTTLFTADDDEPVDLMTEGRTIASIAPIAMATSDDSSWREGPLNWRTPAGAFRIGLVGAGTPIRWEGSTPLPMAGPGVSPAAARLVQRAIEHGVNYLGLGEGAERSTLNLPSGIAHDPGSPQGLNAGESGPKGCSLIEVNSRGQAEIKFLPSGGVRWMSLSVDAPAAVDINQLAERMALVAMESEPHATDDLWLVRWTVRGTTGQWASALADGRNQSDLWDRLERELGAIGGPRRRHTLDVVARPSVERRIDREPGQRDLFEDFCENIDEDALEALEAFKAEMNSPEWSSRGWVRHVRQALSRTSAGDVSRRARDLGESWLG